MRRFTRKPTQPGHHRPGPHALAALRHDFVFTVGVIADTVRGRPFNS